MGEAEPTELAPTELAPTETETASVHAWALAADEFDEIDQPNQLTAGRITGAAVAASVSAIAVAGILGWQHLRGQETAQPLMSSTSPTATVEAAPTTPPVVTVTTVIKQVPPGWLPTANKPAPTSAERAPHGMPIPPDVMALLDQRFIDRLIASNWRIDDPGIIATRAHQVCGLLEEGWSPAGVRAEMVAKTDSDAAEAVTFVSAAMATYPDCPP